MVVPHAVRRAEAWMSRLREGEPPVGERLPLSLLRAPTGTRVTGADWKLEPDGVLGRVLEISAGTTLTYPLHLGGPVTFAAQAMLYPHDWRDREGAVRLSVSATTPTGTEELSAIVLRAGDRGRPSGTRIRAELPARTSALHLTVAAQRAASEHPVERAILVEPALWDPAGVSRPPSKAPATAPPASELEDGPMFSVLMPVHDPPPAMLAEAVESVRAQTFASWELCLIDDGSRNPAILAAIEEYASDPRVRTKRHPVAQGISAATNGALDLARGRYIALLDHDDTLAPDALEHVAAALAANPALDMVYSDEDIVQDGVVIEPHPKPGWSPEHMTALMYTCHLGVYRRTLVEKLGGFRTAFDGCQDFDFVLRLMERTDRIAHVPRILYHWRAHPASTATFGGGAKPHAFLAQPAAIAEHLARTGVEAEVRYGYLPGIHRIVHRVDPALRVAFALCVTESAGLAAAARSWLAQPHDAWHAVIVAPERLHAELRDVLRAAGVGTERQELRAPNEPTDPVAGLSEAAARAADLAEQVLILQSPAAGLTRDWLTRLLGYGTQPGVAAVGPVLLGEDGSIAQAGVALPEGVPLHLLHDLPPVSAPPAVQNVSAVSGALLTPAAVLRELGGLRPGLREFTLIEYCMRARHGTGRIVLVPDARLRITGPDPTLNDLPAIWSLRRQWLESGETGDAYFNAGYLTDRGDLAMRPG